MHCRANLFYTVFFLCTIFLTSCETPLYNDLAAQGTWKKECEINYITKTIILKIDSDKIYWKEDKTDIVDWTVMPCAASFGTLTIKPSGQTIKGSYNAFFYYMLISGFVWESGYLWLNGIWQKQ